MPTPRRQATPRVDLDPLSQTEVEQHLRQLDRDIVDQIEVVAELYAQCGEAEHNFKVSQAKSLMASKLSSKELREAEALVANADLNWKYKVLYHRLQAALEKGRMLKARAEMVRSLNANVRDAVAHASGEGW